MGIDHHELYLWDRYILDAFQSKGKELTQIVRETKLCPQLVLKSIEKLMEEKLICKLSYQSEVFVRNSLCNPVEIKEEDMLEMIIFFILSIFRKKEKMIRGDLLNSRPEEFLKMKRICLVKEDMSEFHSLMNQLHQMIEKFSEKNRERSVSETTFFIWGHGSYEAMVRSYLDFLT
jgi:hypothetical protein